MKLSRFIARRYLFAKKSLGVINIISIISAAGIAVGCAALVIILSIYNGFDSIVRELNDSYTADILITPAKGKVFSYDSRFDFLGRDPRVKAACGVLEESVFIQYGERNKVVVARGVDSLFEQTTRLRDHVTEGDFALTGSFCSIAPMLLLARALRIPASSAVTAKVTGRTKTELSTFVKVMHLRSRAGLAPTRPRVLSLIAEIVVDMTKVRPSRESGISR
jgi:hypothetical protein